MVVLAPAAVQVPEWLRRQQPERVQRHEHGQGASLNGFVPFATDSLWNKDISASPVDANSSAIINFIGPTRRAASRFWFGAVSGFEHRNSLRGSQWYAISGEHRLRAPMAMKAIPGPMPIPCNAPIEGDPNPGGDRHVLVLDNSRCFLYEFFASVPNTNGSWNADSAAVWDLLANEQRPWTWTSADAAGLPIFPGLVRYDEVAAGQIQHAIRFTLPQSRAAMVPPASHWAVEIPPVPMRRQWACACGLRPSYDISGFSTQRQGHPHRDEEVRPDHGR